MKVVKVIQTFKDGLLTASKKITIPNPITPKHHRILDVGDSLQAAFSETQRSLSLLKAEVGALRKKLITSEKAVVARTKERDCLKLAYSSKAQSVLDLLEENEELSAKLFGATEDLSFLNEALTKQSLSPSPIPSSKPLTSSKFVSSSKLATHKSNADKPEPSKPDNTPARSIAAKPVKR